MPTQLLSSVGFFVTPWTAACQAPLSMGFSPARTLEWVAISFSNAWKWKRREEKVGLKLNLQKTKIMASGPIASWQIDGETMETVTDFIFWGSWITADDCSHELKICLLLGRKAMTNLDSILKNRDITLPEKGQCTQSYGFSITLLLIIANILFQQRKRRLCTWTSPDGQYWNQIDCILCSQRCRSSIQSAKTRRSWLWLR